MSIYPTFFAVQLAAAERLPFCNAARRARHTAQRWLEAWAAMRPVQDDFDEREQAVWIESAPVDAVAQPHSMEMAAAALVALDDLAAHPGSTVSDIALRTRLDADAVQYVLAKQRSRGHLRVTPTGYKQLEPQWRYWQAHDIATTQAADIQTHTAHTHAGANNS